MPMLELFQAEWCPFSHLVRERLTELGVDFVARQVAAYPADREAMRAATAEDTIPVMVTEDGTILRDTNEILAWLDETFEETPQSDGHREQLQAHR